MKHRKPRIRPTSSASSVREEVTVSDLLRDYDDLCIDAEHKIVRCTLTGHEMPAEAVVIHKYVTGARYLRAKKLTSLLSQYGQYFEDGGNHFYVCKLTCRTIAKSADSIEAHIRGRRFAKALAKSEKGDSASAAMDTDLPEKKHEQTPDAIKDDTSSSEEENEANSYKDDYPELAESDGESGSDYDFNAMDTELDTSITQKRKHKSSNGEDVQSRKIPKQS